MLVCAHGEVSEFCENHDMVIADVFTGDIEEYSGVFRVIVTDMDVSENEYFFLKGKMLARGIELVSTKHLDRSSIESYIAYAAVRESGDRRQKHGGRNMFGFYCDDGEMKMHETGRAVVKRILELRDAGYVYRRIQEDPLVHHPDGRKLSISTIQIIIKNRERYEKEGL